jgi:hypothetical protein
MGFWYEYRSGYTSIYLTQFCYPSKAIFSGDVPPANETDDFVGWVLLPQQRTFADFNEDQPTIPFAGGISRGKKALVYCQPYGGGRSQGARGRGWHR